MRRRDRIILTVVAVSGAIALLWVFAVTPKRDEAKDVKAQVTAAEQRRDSVVQQAAVAEQAKGSYQRDYATVARLGKAVPAKADVPSLVYQLESAARAASVDFRSIRVDSSPAVAPSNPDGAEEALPKSGIEPKSFQFTFQGDFRSLRRLLREINRFSRVKGSKVSVSGRLLTVDTVALNPSVKGLPNIKAEIKAKAYVADVPPQLQGSSSPQVNAGAAASTTTTTSQVAP